MIIQRGVLKNDEIERLVSHHSSPTRKKQLMTLLVILNSKPDSKEILMTACDSLQAEDPQSFYGELREKVRISECSNMIVTCTQSILCFIF